MSHATMRYQRGFNAFNFLGTQFYAVWNGTCTHANICTPAFALTILHIDQAITGESRV